MKDQIDLVMVEDEPDFLEMMNLFLESELPKNVLSYTFNDPQIALDHIERHGANVIVSDYDMPNINGIELYREISDIDPTLPFILHTGKGLEEIAVEAWDAGIDDYLRKGSGNTQRETYEELADKIVSYGTRCMEMKKLDRLKPLGRSILNSEIPLFVVNEDIEITFANEKLLDNLGYEFHEIAGEKPSMINNMPETDYPEISRAIDDENIWTGEEVTFQGAEDQEYSVDNYLVAKVSDYDEEFRVGIAYDFEPNS